MNGRGLWYLRPLLNHLVPASRLPRALGIAATLNEVNFVLAPVGASGFGSISPIVAVLTLTALGATPALLIPHVPHTHVEDAPHGGASVISRPILLWLICTTAEGAAVAAVEMGAVALALKFGYQPALAILFTVPSCLTSAAGGIWVSVRNRMASRKAVFMQMSILTFGSALVAFGPSLATTIVGVVLIGAMFAPLGTYYYYARRTR